MFFDPDTADCSSATDDTHKDLDGSQPAGRVPGGVNGGDGGGGGGNGGNGLKGGSGGSGGSDVVGEGGLLLSTHRPLLTLRTRRG